MTKRLFDSTDANSIPLSGWDALAGYISGNWQSFQPIRNRFPRAPVMSIATWYTHDAMAFDIEKGDGTPDQAPGWLDRQYNRGLTKPALYFGGDIATLRSYTGTRPFWWWTTNGWLWNTNKQTPPALTPGSDATQWQNHGPNGENVDQTIMSDAMFAHLLTGFTAPLNTIEGSFLMALSDAQQLQLFGWVQDLSKQAAGFNSTDGQEGTILRPFFESVATRGAAAALVAANLANRDDLAKALSDAEAVEEAAVNAAAQSVLNALNALGAAVPVDQTQVLNTIKSALSSASVSLTATVTPTPPASPAPSA